MSASLSACMLPAASYPINWVPRYHSVLFWRLPWFQLNPLSPQFPKMNMTLLPTAGKSGVKQEDSCVGFFPGRMFGGSQGYLRAGLDFHSFLVCHWQFLFSLSLQILYNKTLIVMLHCSPSAPDKHFFPLQRPGEQEPGALNSVSKGYMLCPWPFQNAARMHQEGSPLSCTISLANS